uniref:Uncharacterized protein n=1 Tax=Picea glauca TaxID=3330 RepID=A0A124GN26_PICGL|nr:hypothetical protein ABT39_MTgene5682 [Picea glauca]
MLVEAHVEASPVGMLWWADSFRSACSPGLWLAGGGSRGCWFAAFFRFAEKIKYLR